VLALIACGGCGGDQAVSPPLVTATPITAGAAVTAATTVAPPTDASGPTLSAPPPTSGSAPAAAPAAPADAPAAPTSGVPTRSPDTGARWPTTVTGRRVLDQAGDPYLMKAFSSWGMAQNLTDAEITDALERLAARGFNAVNVAPNGVSVGEHWVKYENVEGQPFFTGTPFASPLGPAWATMDHIVSEAERLGMTVLISFFVSWDATGIAPELAAVSDRDAYDYGVAVASRYLDAPNLAWHVMADTEWAPDDDIGRRIDDVFHGIVDTERTPRLIFAEPNRGNTAYQQFISKEGTGDSAYDWLHLSANAVYNYGGDAVEQFDAVWNEKDATDDPVWDCEPPYASAPHYSGDERQQLRERNYATFIRGGSGINYGDEDWWRFGKVALYDGGRQWSEVPDSDTTVDAQHAWALIDAHVSDPTWTPDDGTFLIDGLGSGDTKAASGFSRSSGLVYLPDSRSITVDLSVLGADAVHVRWYDPTNGAFTDVGDFTGTGVLPVSPPADNASGQPDWVLVVERLTP
jgi:hypothetical protein